MEYIILIPAYNPNNKLLKLLREIDNKYPVILINDGSDKMYDDIFEGAKKYAHVINYEENMGKGYALKTGFNYINDNYQDYIVVTMDADGQHTLNDALKLCDRVKDNDDALMIGKRTFDRHTPIRSRIGNRIIRKKFKKATKMNIYDTQSGLRAFSYKLIDYMLEVPGYRYEYEMNVLLNLKDNDIKYREIPIKTIYLDNNRGSHFKTIKDSYLVCKNIKKYKRKKTRICR